MIVLAMIVLAFGIIFQTVIICKLAYENGILKDTVKQDNEEIKYLKIREGLEDE